jgi:hypothetical protein
MEIDPVQTAIERAAAKFSALEWSGLMPAHLRVAAIYAELRRLDAGSVAPPRHRSRPADRPGAQYVAAATRRGRIPKLPLRRR